MPDESLQTTTGAFVGAYTALLIVVAFLCGFVGWFEVGVIDQLEAEGETLWATVIRIDQIVAIILAPTSLLAAVARLRRWPIALPLTRAVSVVMAVIVPIGTALFVYWLFWVRPREARSSLIGPRSWHSTRPDPTKPPG